MKTDLKSQTLRCFNGSSEIGPQRILFSFSTTILGMARAVLYSEDAAEKGVTEHTEYSNPILASFITNKSAIKTIAMTGIATSPLASRMTTADAKKSISKSEAHPVMRFMLWFNTYRFAYLCAKQNSAHYYP
jgi:hypothetical protein